MKSDLEIAQSAHLQKIEDVAKKINITQKALINFGPYMAKINPKELGQTGKKNSKLILVTAMSPTPAGEGKTTTTIGLRANRKKELKINLGYCDEPNPCRRGQNNNDHRVD